MTRQQAQEIASRAEKERVVYATIDGVHLKVNCVMDHSILVEAFVPGSMEVRAEGISWLKFCPDELERLVNSILRVVALAKEDAVLVALKV